MKKSCDLGSAGESLAADYLRKNGYGILEKNFRTRFGEIDIIAKYGDTYVFVEVKTRKGNDCYGVPQLAVNFSKQKHLTLAALTYIKKEALKSDYRFDVIAILDNKIEHIQNAFSPEGYTL